MKKVAIVSQSIDLYGSSQVTIFAAQEASREGWDVSVVLPGDGPLSEKLRNMNVDVVYAEVPSLRRALLRSRPIPELMYIARAMRSFRKLAVVRGTIEQPASACSPSSAAAAAPAGVGLPTPELPTEAWARRFVDGSSKIKKAPPSAEPFLCLVSGRTRMTGTLTP